MVQIKNWSQIYESNSEDGHSIIRTITNSGVICEQSIKIEHIMELKSEIG